MKIEKGKLYYNYEARELFKAEVNGVGYNHTDKIAVHCDNREYWDYVISKYGIDDIKSFQWDFYKVSSYITLNDEGFGNVKTKGSNYHVISIEQFKEFYPEEVEEKDTLLGTKFTTKFSGTKKIFQVTTIEGEDVTVSFTEDGELKELKIKKDSAFRYLEEGSWTVYVEPGDMKIGDVCKFWDSDENMFTVGILEDIVESKYAYRYSNESASKQAKKLTKEEVNELLTKEEVIELLFGKEN